MASPPAPSRRIGVDLGGTKIEAIVLGPDDVIESSVRVPTPREDYPATLATIADLVRRLDPTGTLAVGVGTPGSWIDGRQCMQNCNSTWLNDQPLLTDLEAVLGPRVRIANDADCFALSEARSGSAEGYPLVFGAILGTGVGGGIVVDGRLLRGANGLTGEWGHTPVPERLAALASRRCYCGRTDCIETFLSGPGLLETHRALWPREHDAPVDAAAVYRRAGLGLAPVGWVQAPPDSGSAESRCRSTLGVYCRLLARSLAQIVNVLDPHAIVLGGGLSGMQEIYSPVRELMEQDVFGRVFQTALLPPRWGDASGVRGAAWLWD